MRRGRVYPDRGGGSGVHVPSRQAPDAGGAAGGKRGDGRRRVFDGRIHARDDAHGEYADARGRRGAEAVADGLYLRQYAARHEGQAYGAAPARRVVRLPLLYCCGHRQRDAEHRAAGGDHPVAGGDERGVRLYDRSAERGLSHPRLRGGRPARRRGDASRGNGAPVCGASGKNAGMRLRRRGHEHRGDPGLVPRGAAADAGAPAGVGRHAAGARGRGAGGLSAGGAGRAARGSARAARRAVRGVRRILSGYVPAAVFLLRDP